MRGTFTASIVCALLVSAGCIGTTDDELDAQSTDALPDVADVEAFALDRLLQDHDHMADHAAHVGTTGFDEGVTVPARSGTYADGEVYMEAAVKAGYAFVTFGPRNGFVNPGDEAGVAIYDVSDPTAPELVGTWLGQPLGDVEVSDDGNWMFASTQRNGYPYPYTVNPDAGVQGHQPRGTFIVDVADKANPETVGFAPLPTNGPHTITYVTHPDGRELLLQSTYDILFTAYPENVGQNSASQKVVISEIVDAPTGRQLQPLSIFQIPVVDEGDASMFPHDATAHVDPATGRLIMDVGYWDVGYVTVDITDPSEPIELARFADTSPSAYVQTHNVRVFPGTIDGRTVAVMEPEIPSGGDAGQFTFVDVTDPAAPTKLGYWTIPGELVIDQPFVFSPHNFDVVCAGDGQVNGEVKDYGAPCESPMLVASHFHGGLWAIDASDPTSPEAVGFHFPEIARDNVGDGFPFTGFATVFVDGGYAFAPEIWTGLNVLAVPGLGGDGGPGA